LVYRKPLFEPKIWGKVGKNGNGLVLKVGCNTKTRLANKIIKFEETLEFLNVIILYDGRQKSMVLQ
jgi:hypothetical protein